MKHTQLKDALIYENGDFFFFLTYNIKIYNIKHQEYNVFTVLIF